MLQKGESEVREQVWRWKLNYLCFQEQAKNSRNDDVKVHGGEKGCESFGDEIWLSGSCVRTEQMVGNALSVDGSVE